MPAIIAAACNGNISGVRRCVERGDNINTQDEDGRTALHWTLSDGYREISEYLIIAGADINIRDNDGYTALHRAVISGYREISEYLVRAGADISIRDKDGRTALHYVASRGQRDTAEYLIRAGADINIQDNDGDTALHRAADYDQRDTAEYLIRAGADINIRNKKGKTPVAVAKDESMFGIIRNAHAERQRQQEEAAAAAATAEKRKVFTNSFPETWGLKLYDDSDIPAPSLVELERKSWEFVMASSIFGSNDFDSMADIVRIERVQNVELYRHYDFKRTDIASRNDGNANEALLKHGTRKTSPEMIWNSGPPRNNRYGFDFRYSHDSNFYGRGSYFTGDTSYAHRYSYECPNSNNERQIFLALVAQGSVEQKDAADSSIIVPKDGCQSVRGPILGSIQGLIVYEHHQSYPAYLVTYRMRQQMR